MTAGARMRRDFRHVNEKAVMAAFAQTPAGKRSRFGQVKAAARQILMQCTRREARAL